ncbi:MAG: DUF3800 domain-containing protein [Chloroflexi bacterium]|nr:DUF3800 domain-containing protein [Chloroflexota bacterium]
MAQYHYLDDSGDPGLSGAEGSSSYFVLAMVQLAEHNALSALAAVRQALHLPARFEFKTYKTTRVQKQHFFHAVEQVQFRVRAVVIDKRALTLPFTEMGGQELMVEFTTRLVLRAPEAELANDVLIVDAGTPALCRALRLRLSVECRQRERERPFSKIVGGRSQNEDGLQLADMIAGAIRQYVVQGQKEHYATFVNKVIDLWQEPER